MVTHLAQANTDTLRNFLTKYKLRKTKLEFVMAYNGSIVLKRGGLEKKQYYRVFGRIVSFDDVSVEIQGVFKRHHLQNEPFLLFLNTIKSIRPI